jgi:hypothetical protein
MATSNQTKRYGNGTTAGQVALEAGYSGMLHGPGNSQPHKAALCGGQEVDVHALSAPGQRKKCGSTQITSVTAATTSKGSSHSSSASVAGQTASGGVAGTAGTGTGSTAQGAQGGVLGVTASAGSGGPAGGVLGAIESVGQGTLPFTGFPLWVVVLAAGTLIPVGLALRRQARATV